MASNSLFPELDAAASSVEPSSSTPEETQPVGRPRLRSPDRLSVTLMTSDLDSLLPPDHNARAVWLYVQRMDLTSLYDAIQARGSRAGRPCIDPRLPMALWLFATLEGVGSARALDRLCSEHIAYRWLCGGVSVNYHSLADFRVEHGALLEKLLVDGAATLLAGGLVDMARVAQDGMRVRAHAGASSFKRRQTIERMRNLAREQVQRLRGQLQGGDAQPPTPRQQSARQRAARELEDRLDRALEAMDEVEKAPRRSKKKPKKAPPPKPEEGEAEPSQTEAEDKASAQRVSVTDPEVRVMKMADGGFRPATNVQLAADVGTQIILGVEVTNIGSDKAQMLPMLEQLEEHYGRRPGQMLVDNGFVRLDAIEQAEERGTEVIAPVQKPRDPTRDPYQPLKGDGDGVAAWRKRMGTDEAKATYIQRGATIECINGLLRNRGLQRFNVVGLLKQKAVVLWHALAHNLRRALILDPHLALGGGV